MNSPPKAETLNYGTPIPALSWRFPGCFWVGNIAELFERAAFYAMFIVLTLYLTNKVGFTDVQTGYVIAVFSFMLYLMPPFTGTLADKIGYKISLLGAFASLAIGYALLGALQSKTSAIVSLAFIAAGGSMVKPVILGTTAKCSDQINRARAFSIFYFMVNVGAFTGKTIAKPLRAGDFPLLGPVENGLIYINYFAAIVAIAAFLLIAIAYKNPNTEGTGRSFDEVLAGFLKVLGNGRFMVLIVIVAGFWLIQGQLYASMPKYMIRLIGNSASPEWLANINPFVVVVFVVPVTHLVRNFKAQNSIAIALTLIPISALMVTLAPLIQARSGNSLSVLGAFTIHPVTLMVIIGIAMQGFAECFLSPKFMEFASKQAPRGEEGLYMGFQNLSVALSWLVGFIMSGYLLDKFCPDPLKLKTENPSAYEQWESAIASGGTLPDVYANAHYIWYFFAGVGLLALITLLVFNRITSRQDSLRAATDASRV